MERNVEIVTDSEKKKIVRIHNIRFKGKRSIEWGQVREYLKNYVGAAYEIVETKDIIYIGSDMMHILNYLYMMKMEKSRGIIVLGQQC